MSSKTKQEFSKKHLSDARKSARNLERKYSVAIIKWDGEHTWVSGNNKQKLIQWVKPRLKAGDYRKIKIEKLHGKWSRKYD